MDFYHYGLFGLFLVCFISSSLWPLGSEAFVIGFLAFGFNPYAVLIVASFGNVLGSLSTYYLAYFGGDLSLGRIFSRKKVSFGKNTYLKKKSPSKANISTPISAKDFSSEQNMLSKQKLFSKSILKKPVNLESHKCYVSKFGWLCAFFAFLPFIGDLLVLLLGFYRYNQCLTIIFIALGKVARYVVLIYLYLKWNIS